MGIEIIQSVDLITVSVGSSISDPIIEGGVPEIEEYSVQAVEELPPNTMGGVSYVYHDGVHFTGVPPVGSLIIGTYDTDATKVTRWEPSNLYSLVSNSSAHIALNITSSQTVHGILQGSGNGFDADMVDGRHVDDNQSTTGYMWTAGKTISYLATSLSSYSLTSHTHTLDGLSDVDTTGVASGSIIKFNGSSWVVAEDGGISSHGGLSDILGMNWADTDADLDKHVSNANMKSLYDHTVLVSGNPHSVVHSELGSILAADWTDTDTDLNRHVSNNQMKTIYDLASSGGGTLDGSGTTNYIPIFTATTTIGNSIISQSGTDISIAGSLTCKDELVLKDIGGNENFSVRYDDFDSLTMTLDNFASNDGMDVTFKMQGNLGGTGVFGVKDIIPMTCAASSLKRYSLNGNVIISRTELGSNIGEIEGNTMWGADSTPVSVVHVQKSQATYYIATFENTANTTTGYGIKVRAGNNSSGELVGFFNGVDTKIGAITFSGGTVTYGAFTGWHPCILKQEDNNEFFDYALIERIGISEKSNGSNVIYDIQLTRTANSKKVLGVLAVKRSSISSEITALEAHIGRLKGKKAGKEKFIEMYEDVEKDIEDQETKKIKIEKDIKKEKTKENLIALKKQKKDNEDKIKKLNFNKRVKEKSINDLPRLNQQIELKTGQIADFKSGEYEYCEVFCLGNGLTWVCNENGNLEDNDYLVTSNIIGCGMKQDSETQTKESYAYITEDVDWSLETDTKKLVSCVYLKG